MEKFSRVLPFLFFLMSFVVLFLSFKLHLPLSGSVEGSPEAFKVEFEGLLREGFQGSLSFPFPCRGQNEGNEGIKKAPVEKALPKVTFVYIGQGKYALLGEELLKEGDRWGEWKIKAITLSGVVLEDEKGERRWVSLEE